MTIEERSTARAIQEIAKEMKKAPKIDWEQRRYEIAKDCLPSFIQFLCNVTNGNDYDFNPAITMAVNMADALIERLKEWKV